MNPKKPEPEDAPLLDDIFTWGGEIDGVMVDGVHEDESESEEQDHVA